MQPVSVAGAVWLALASLWIGQALALDPPKPRPERDSLETVYDRLQRSAERAQTLEERERALSGTLNAIRTETVDIARRMQRLDSLLVELDAEIADAQARRDRLSDALSRDDRTLADLIVTLQRLKRNPPEMHVLAVENPLAAARAEMVLQGALPRVLSHAAALRADIEEMNRLDAALTERREDQRRAFAKLNGEADRLAKLRADRAAALGRTQAEKRAADESVARLSRDAETLKDLVQALEEEEARRKAEAEAAARIAPPTPRPNTPRPETGTASDSPAAAVGQRPETATLSGQGASATRTALPGPPRPEIPPAEARGLFTPPSPGRIVTRYGERTGTRQTSKGIEIASRANSTIVAPYDGMVAFAGPFRGYGRLLIIDHGDGYHSLMAGLGRLDGAVGQAVLAGEPIGLMGQGQASLYYELRRNGDPIDPSAWLAPADEANKR